MDRIRSPRPADRHAAWSRPLRITAAAVLVALPAAVAAAGNPSETGVRPLQFAQATGADTFTQAEVRRVDRDGRKLTLKHGEIKNLSMPPMTMVFQVSDPVMLDAVKAGDTVRFKAIERSGTYVVTEIEKAR
jgi:Cu/Ag efflux protein CusF